MFECTNKKKCLNANLEIFLLFCTMNNFLDLDTSNCCSTPRTVKEHQILRANKTDGMRVNHPLWSLTDKRGVPPLIKEHAYFHL